MRQGRITLDRLVELIAMLQRQVEATQEELKAAQQRIAELEEAAGQAGSATAKTDQPYSMKAEEKREQRKKGKRKRNKRLRTTGANNAFDTVERLLQDMFIEKQNCRQRLVLR